MCKICDDLKQWVCECGRIVRIGSDCRCGGRRGDTYVDCVTVWVVENVRGVNRAGRRKAQRRRAS